VTRTDVPCLVAIPADLYRHAERAALRAGWKSLDALVEQRLRRYVEYGDHADGRGPKAAADDWEPVPL